MKIPDVQFQQPAACDNKVVQSNALKAIGAAQKSNEFVNTLFGIYGNVWARLMYFPTKDTEHQGHTHPFDHITLLATGSLRVETPGYAAKEFTAPAIIMIHADHAHKLVALEDGTTAFCLHALREADGEVVVMDESDPYTHPVEKL